MSKSKNSYRNIIKNEVVYEEDFKFQKRINKLNDIHFIGKKIEEGLKDSRIVEIRKERKSDVIIIERNNEKIAFLHRPLKNSGVVGKDNKRWQVYRDCKKIPNMKNYLLGSYTTENKIFFSIHDDEKFIENYVGETYSSSWIDFGIIEEAVTNNYSIGSNQIRGGKKYDDKVGRLRMCFESNIFEDSLDLLYLIKDNNNFVEEIRRTNVKKIKLSDAYDFKFTIFNKKKDTYKGQNNRIKTRRVSMFIKVATSNAENKCEYCEDHISFYKPNDKMYVEGHHLLPVNYSTQKEFKNKLDHPENIFSLCPNCHKQVHYGKIDDKEVIIENLFNKRRYVYKTHYEIKKYEDILRFYNGVEVEED